MMEKTSELIELYEERRLLYNTKDKNYRNRDLRSKALAEAAALDILGVLIHGNYNTACPLSCHILYTL